MCKSNFLTTAWINLYKNVMSLSSIQDWEIWEEYEAKHVSYFIWLEICFTQIKISVALFLNKNDKWWYSYILLFSWQMPFTDIATNNLPNFGLTKIYCWWCTVKTPVCGFISFGIQYIITQSYIEILHLKLRAMSQFKSMARSYNAMRDPAPSKRRSIPGCSVW